MTTDDLDRMGCQVLDVVGIRPMLEVEGYWWGVETAWSDEIPRRNYRVALVIVDGDEDGEQ
jgi:hypothetical protein